MGLFSGSSSSNDTCPTFSLAESPTDPVTGTWTFHHLNLVISGVSTAFSCVVILALMANHAMHLSKPKEQLSIMRICLVIPASGILNLIAVAAPQTYVYLHPFTDLAQAIALGYFFLLMLELLAPNESRRDTFFAALKVPPTKSKKNHGVQKHQSGLAWYRRQWIAIFQYAPVSLVVAILTCIFQAVNKYCLTSSKPRFAHLWLNLIHSIALTFAVTAVIRFYKVLKSHLAGHKPLAKLLAFKLLVGLNFALQIIFWILNDVNPSPLAPTSKLSYSDVTVGIPLLVNCLLMVPFSVFFHYAYDVRPYHLDRLFEPAHDAEMQPLGSAVRPTHYQGGPLGIKAWVWVWNPMELISAVAFSFKMASELQRSTRQQQQQGAKRGSDSTDVGVNTAYYGGGPPPTYGARRA